jgi:hypothetical protein
MDIASSTAKHLAVDDTIDCTTFNLSSSNLDGATSMCGNSGQIHATSNQPHAPLHQCATTEGLCTLHGSSSCPVTRVEDGHKLMDKLVGGTLESYGIDYHSHVLVFCCCDDYDTWDWEHGWDPWRALCYHEDDVEDRLS